MPQISNNFQVFGLVIALLAGVTTSNTMAQSEKSLPKEGKAITADFNPWDKLTGIEMHVAKSQLDWGGLYAKMAVDVIKDTKLADKDVAIPFALGVRICDGLFAIKAKDKEKLNACSADIEDLAKKMGVADSELVKAKEIKLYANNGEWLRVVLELGMLKKSIVESIDRNVGPDARRIIMLAGWLQGVRYISLMISEHYNENTAGIMREPKIVAHLLEEFSKLPDTKGESEIGKTLHTATKEIGKLVDVPLYGTVAEVNIKKLHEVADKAIQDCLKAMK